MNGGSPWHFLLSRSAHATLWFRALRLRLSRTVTCAASATLHASALQVDVCRYNLWIAAVSCRHSRRWLAVVVGVSLIGARLPKGAAEYVRGSGSGGQRIGIGSGEDRVGEGIFSLVEHVDRECCRVYSITFGFLRPTFGAAGITVDAVFVGVPAQTGEAIVN